MFGLLGGLMGRGMARPMMSRPFARKPLGGLLGGRLMGNALNPRRARPTSLSGGRAPEEAEKDEPQQAAPPVQAEAAPQEQPTVQPPAPPPASEKMAEGFRDTQETRQETTQEPQAAPEQKTVTSSLLDEAPPAAAPQKPDEDRLAPPQQVANMTDAMTPVAPQEELQFPNVPKLDLSGLTDRVGEIPGRRNILVEDPVPLKQADVKSQARHTANRPDMSFGLASSATAYTPTYSYRR